MKALCTCKLWTYALRCPFIFLRVPVLPYSTGAIAVYRPEYSGYSASCTHNRPRPRQYTPRSAPTDTSVISYFYQGLCIVWAWWFRSGFSDFAASIHHPFTPFLHINLLFLCQQSLTADSAIASLEKSTPFNSMFLHWLCHMPSLCLVLFNGPPPTPGRSTPDCLWVPRWF